MWAFIGVLGFLAAIVFLILGIVSSYKRQGNSKKRFLIAGASLVVMIIGFAATPSAKPESNAANASPTATLASTTQAQDDAQNQADEEAKKKADAEAKAKEEADAKAKAEEEAKAKAQQEAEDKANAAKEFTANLMEVLVPSITTDQKLTTTTHDFIVANNTWFPAKTDEDKKATKLAVNTQVTSKHLFKNVVPHLSEMVKITGQVVQVREENTDAGILSSIHIIDDDGGSIMGVYLGSTGDLLDDDMVTLYGVPMASYSFDNIGGGTTLAILLAVSDFQKVM